jgi:hypothetical protein
MFYIQVSFHLTLLGMPKCKADVVLFDLIIISDTLEDEVVAYNIHVGVIKRQFILFLYSNYIFL